MKKETPTVDSGCATTTVRQIRSALGELGVDVSRGLKKRELWGIFMDATEDGIAVSK